jgi:hypothetical protein
MHRATLAPIFALLAGLAASVITLAGQPPSGEQARPARTQAPGSPSDRVAPSPGARSPRNANYSIDVRLDPTARTLSGRERLTWRNIAPVPADDLRFHLYYNAWKNADSTWLREASLSGRRTVPPNGEWAWIDVVAIRLIESDDRRMDLTPRKRYIAPDDGNAQDQTVMAVPLPRSIAPGETIEVEIEWTSKVPRTFARTGFIGDFFFLAQWFPKIGVLEQNGWNCHQFHAGTEFYADYGAYDVRITVPRGWVVGATGREQERRDAGDGTTTTYRYAEQDVHDFAWTTSPDYLERKARFDEPGLPAVEMRLLLQQEHESQADRHVNATRAALKYYGLWFGPYPYGHITIVDPAWRSGAGGMEYPTLFTAGTRWIAPDGVADPEGVTVHECGHQFWYALVGNNEFEHAWLDEGLNTFSTGRVMERAFQPNYESRRFFNGFVPYVFRDIAVSRAVDENGLSGYRQHASSDAPSTPSYRYFPASGGALSYSKTALWLHTLERYLGWPALQRIMSTFFDRWKFRHPTPEDFFAVVNEVSGRDMTWFFDQVYRSSNVFDYGVQQIASTPVGERGYYDRGGRRQLVKGETSGAFRSDVVVRRYGEAVFPVEVLVTFANGETVTERWDGEPRWKTFSYVRRSPVASAVVDPRRVLLLDVNYTNNTRTVSPAAAAASRKWTLKWMGWLEDLLITYAFFV